MRVRPTASLDHALTGSARDHGATIVIVAATATAWESATFSGARHILHARGTDGAPLAAWLSALPELDLPLRGQLLADIRVVDEGRTDNDRCVTIEALTVVAD